MDRLALVGAVAVAVAVAAGAPRVARADDPAGAGGAGVAGGGRTFSEQLADRLTELGDAIGDHVGALSLDAVRFRLDGRARRAHLRLAGESRWLSLTIEGDVHFRGGGAQVEAAIDLTLAGRGLRLELPDFEVVPRSFLGERYVEVRLPLVRGTF